MSKPSLLRSSDGTSYLLPFALVTSLFLLWGFAHGLLDVLDKHFQNILHVSKMESGFVQFSLYIGYLVMDLDQDVSDDVRKAVAALETNIRTRILY